MDKVWFITGASSGLGAVLAAEVLARGGVVAATFRKQEQADAFTAGSVRSLGLLLDVSDSNAIEAATAAVIDHFGSVDVLVNNAGYGTIGAIEEFSMEEIRHQVETNFFGALALTRSLLPHMRGQGSGHIIQISSAAGFKATGGFGIYNASKFALEGFSEALAQEVEPFGIKVVIVQPGPFRTKFAAGSVRLAANRMEDYRRTPVAQMYHYIQRIDGRQEGDPLKAADAIINYVVSNAKPLRLPLGKHAIDAIRAKITSVQKDLESNEAIARSTGVDAPL